MKEKLKWFVFSIVVVVASLWVANSFIGIGYTAGYQQGFEEGYQDALEGTQQQAYNLGYESGWLNAKLDAAKQDHADLVLKADELGIACTEQRKHIERVRRGLAWDKEAWEGE